MSGPDAGSADGAGVAAGGAGGAAGGAAFVTGAAWYAHRVSYGETDQMGYAYYGEYLHFFERARSFFIREAGMSYAEVERRGLLLPVREAACRYRAPAHYDDLIWVCTGVREWGRASVTFGYEVWDESRATLLATGHTQHACVDAARRRPMKTPDWLRGLWPA